MVGKRNTIANVRRMAAIIQERGEIKAIQLCIKMGMAMSTMYNYKKFLEEMFPDIEYDGEYFRATKKD